MKAITIKQPYATLIKEGIKEYEFRTWNTKYRGDILIHAGLGIDKEALKRFEHLNLDYPSGCIIAKATITDSIYVDEKFVNDVYPKNPSVYKNIIDKKDKDVYGFKIENVKKIKPIPIKGKLSLWNYEGEVEWKNI